MCTFTVEVKGNYILDLDKYICCNIETCIHTIRRTKNIRLKGKYNANTFTFYNTDNEKPIIFGMSSNITKLSVHPSVVVNWTEPMASDNSGVQTLTSSHSSGSMFPVGSTSVVYTSTDPSGNTEMLTLVVIVKGKCIVFYNLHIVSDFFVDLLVFPFVIL